MISIVALSVFILDRLTKILAVNNLSQGQSVDVVRNIFHITLIFNNGTAFGLFHGKTVFFILFSLIVIVLIIAYIRRERKKPVSLSIAMGLILGGACGNLVDRVRFGYVIDFLDFRIWPVFNIADSAVTVGAAIILWKLLKSRKGL